MARVPLSTWCDLEYTFCDLNPLFVSLLTGSPRETASHPRYHWDSRRRGPEPYLIFQYTWSGSGAFHDGQREIAVPTGHGFLTTAKEESAYYYPTWAREPWTFAWMELEGAEVAWKELRREYGSVVPLSATGDAVAFLREITTHYVQRRFRDRFQSSELVLRFIMEMYRELTFSSQRKNSPIEYAKQYMDDHHQRPLSIKELAGKLEMSREHFSRSFTTAIRQTPGAYLRELRMLTAERLLRQGSQAITKVSRLSGFTSTSHFCRAFRLRNGCSPEIYRKKFSG